MFNNVVRKTVAILFLCGGVGRGRGGGGGKERVGMRWDRRGGGGMEGNFIDKPTRDNSYTLNFQLMRIILLKTSNSKLII